MVSRRHYKFVLRLATVLVAAVAVGGALYTNNNQTTKAAAPLFSFAVANDFNTTTGDALSTMSAIGGTNAAFWFANGDLTPGDDPSYPPSTFCSSVNSRVNKPTLIVAGNHDTEDSTTQGNIVNFVGAGCAQPSVGTVSVYPGGTYAEDYYYDYPASSPKVRIIAIIPGINTTSGTGPYPTPSQSYAVGSGRYTWVQQAIQTAKSNGEWVVIAWHKPYINAGSRHGSDPSQIQNAMHDVFNLAVQEKADLILGGHEHTYQRTKQLAHTAGCTDIVYNTYNASCVVNDGSTNSYTSGNGTVEVVNASANDSGAGLTTNDGDYNYLTSATSTDHGFLTFDVSDTDLVAKFNSVNGTFADTFTITKAAAPTDTTAPVVSLTNPSNNFTTNSNTLTVAATSTDDTAVTKLEVYVSGVTAPLATVTTNPGSYSNAFDISNWPNGDYTITVKAYDAAGNIGTATAAITVNRTTSTDTTPPTVSLSKPVAGTFGGTISMGATASDDSGVVTKVEFYQGTTLLGTATTSPYAYAWDSTKVANGSYTITAKAYDAAGNVGTSAAVTVTVSNTAGTTPTTPATSFTTPMVDNATKNLTASFSGPCNSVGASGPADTTKAPAGQALIAGASFALSCGTTGVTADVSLSLAGVYDTAKLRVYKLNGSTLTEITSKVSIAVNGANTVITYTLTDGGFGDEDATANKEIVDPVYVTSVAGVSTTTTTTSGLANTGNNVWFLIASAFIAIGLSAVVIRKGVAKR